MKKPNVTQRRAAKGNYYPGRAHKISRITFHHIVGDAPAAIARFQTTGVEVSATYVISSKGKIYQCVPEKYTPYSDGSSTSNARTISIEHAGGTKDLAYKDAMYKASMHLCAYLISKYKISDFKRHRDVIDKRVYPGGTACPGKLDVEKIVTGAKKLLQPKKVYITVKPNQGLSSIAKAAHMKDWALPAAWKRISRLNGHGDSWSKYNDSLKPGQKVRVK
jgi:N-acetyl-anhydromuramyl-L-alanine amidase AmpD